MDLRFGAGTRDQFINNSLAIVTARGKNYCMRERARATRSSEGVRLSLSLLSVRTNYRALLLLDPYAPVNINRACVCISDEEIGIRILSSREERESSANFRSAKIHKFINRFSSSIGVAFGFPRRLFFVYGCPRAFCFDFISIAGGIFYRRSKNSQVNAWEITFRRSYIAVNFVFLRLQALRFFFSVFFFFRNSSRISQYFLCLRSI